jgi:phosphatidylglycerophosphate synthase
MNELMRSTQESWQHFTRTQKLAAVATNALTLSRPLITSIVSRRGADLNHEWNWGDTTLLGVGFLTDLEGGIARRFAAQTRLGGALDPLADKMATNMQEAALAYRHEESFTRTGLRLARDIGISALRHHVVNETAGEVQIQATGVGKLNTVIRKSAIAFATSPIGEKHPALRSSLQYASLATTLLSGAITARRLLEAKRISKTAAHLSASHEAEQYDAECLSSRQSESLLK